MEIKIDNVYVDSLYPLFPGEDVTVAIDSSKTNTAIEVYSLTSRDRRVIELGGKSVNNVVDLGLMHRRELDTALSKCNIILAGIEDIITKKDNEGVRNTHEVRFKLTFIYSSFTIFLQERTGKNPIPVNNQAWKSLILGSTLNKRSIYKGSVQYVSDNFPKYRGYSNDVTDSICIGEYLRITNNLSSYFKPTEREAGRFKVMFMPFSSANPLTSKHANEFSFNYDLSLIDNVNFISNRTKKGTYSFCKLDLASTSVEDICTLFSTSKKDGGFKKMEPFIYLVIYHKEGIE